MILKKLLLILGNGFTIDFVNAITEADKQERGIDVTHLFRFGDIVKFPDKGIPGFLSHKYCPSLWLLGVRPNHDECMSIIEEVITCSNMLFDYSNVKDEDGDKTKSKLKVFDNPSLYIKAYCELIAYLRHLFIEYDRKIKKDEIIAFLNNGEWGWSEFLRNASEKYDEISIVTYNYDIWLERILETMNIKFSICGFTGEERVNIIKPHGSISFIPKSGKQRLYSISYSFDSTSIGKEQITVSYDDLDCYDKSYLIPPAGDSSRRCFDTWATYLRQKAVTKAKQLKANDDVIVCGMSYWHVDRKELDELLINLDPEVNLILLNPHPPKDLNAVLVSLFKNYTVFTSSHVLREVIK